MKPAACGLLMLDLQEDFLARPGLEPNAAVLVENALHWLEKFRVRRLPVAHVHMLVDRKSDRRMKHWSDRGIWLCERGTPGALTPRPLTPLPGEPVFEKTGFILSEPGALSRWAREQAGGRVLLAGVMTHACVYHQAALLLGEGVEVGLAEGSLCSDQPGFAAATLVYLTTKGVAVIAPGEFTRFLESGLSVPAGRRAERRSQRLPKSKPVEWGRVRPALMRWARALHRAAPRLAEMAADTIGKPVDIALDEIRTAEAGLLATIARRDAFEASDCGAEGVATRRPLGRVLVLTPWNNPVAIPVGRIAPALAYGNIVLWKPSPHAGRLSRTLLTLAEESGLEAGWLHCVTGGADVAETWLADARIDAATFSGSSANGRRVLALCSARMLPCQLELGGNNAAVICADADLDSAAAAVVAGAFHFSGQRCTANRRVILLPGIKRRFLDALHRCLEELKPGHASNPGCRLGPMRCAAAAAAFEMLLRRIPNTARVARFHETLCRELGPAWAAPALVENASSDSEIVREESFAPVLVIQEARSWNHALRLLNAVPQGLVAALFTESGKRWKEFCLMAQAGVLKWNSATAGPVGDLPFGGWKASGFGGAEHGVADAHFFTRHQSQIDSPAHLR